MTDYIFVVINIFACFFMALGGAYFLVELNRIRTSTVTENLFLSFLIGVMGFLVASTGITVMASTASAFYGATPITEAKRLAELNAKQREAYTQAQDRDKPALAEAIESSAKSRDTAFLLASARIDTEVLINVALAILEMFLVMVHYRIPKGDQAAVREARKLLDSADSQLRKRRDVGSLQDDIEPRMEGANDA